MQTVAGGKDAVQPGGRGGGEDGCSATCGGGGMDAVQPGARGVWMQCNLWWGPGATCSGGQLGVWIVQPVVGSRCNL